MDDTPENGSLILLDKARDMLEKGAPNKDVLAMILELQVYNTRRANSEALKLQRLQKHDIVQWAMDYPKISIPTGIAYFAIVIPEARHWLWNWLMNTLGIR
jgi:hypothetical protein